MTRTPKTRPEPIRHRLAGEFVASAKDAGDPAMLAVSRRVWWAVHPCRPEEMEVFRDWCAS